MILLLNKRHRMENIIGDEIHCTIRQACNKTEHNDNFRIKFILIWRKFLFMKIENMDEEIELLKVSEKDW